ncbi:MAG: GNAT family N-acetyltransferase [Roseibium sp.]|uniref:GNAT family N-acetyltransferase n=1 Tax=Roseibium sp. TaxID=1936156 RepID=UPI00261EC585|nr:GNAT family N-acetyltransferase [Roseibium sp.]MCV0425264.1 GNAT family N-acetyltransferase [Roseibium sp.]
MSTSPASSSPVRATPGDAQGLHDLADRSYEHFIPVINATPAPMLADYAALVRDHEVWVIRSGDDLAASLALVPHDDHLLIESIAVDPNQQGNGFGRIMLDWAQHRTEMLKLPEMKLYTHVLMTWNRTWYKRAGFTETHEEQRGDKRIVHMSKKLSVLQ